MPPDEIVIFELFSSEYGWTPDQIRSLRMEELLAYYEIIRQKRILQNMPQ